MRLKGLNEFRQMTGQCGVQIHDGRLINPKFHTCVMKTRHDYHCCLCGLRWKNNVKVGGFVMTVKLHSGVKKGKHESRG